jgi:hypothetical protein
MMKRFACWVGLVVLLVILLPLAGCLRGPSLVTEAEFRGLLSEAQIEQAVGRDLDLTPEFVDLSGQIADPAQRVHIDNYYAISYFSQADSAEGVVLEMIDFDSEAAATQFLRNATAGSPLAMMERPAGLISFSAEVNQAGVGSVVIFQTGETLGELLVRTPQGAAPLMGLPALESLARQVAAKL